VAAWGDSGEVTFGWDDSVCLGVGEDDEVLVLAEEGVGDAFHPLRDAFDEDEQVRLDG
jgi:hypothetical protein